MNYLLFVLVFVYVFLLYLSSFVWHVTLFNRSGRKLWSFGILFLVLSSSFAFISSLLVNTLILID